MAKVNKQVFNEWLQKKYKDPTQYYSYVKRVEDSLPKLGLRYVDLEEAFHDDGFKEVIRRLLELEGDAKSGGSRYKILIENTRNPTIYIATARGFLKRYKEFLEDKVPPTPIKSDVNKEKEGSEAYYSGGEGPNHKALRLRILREPQLVRRGLRPENTETEVELVSGDRVDVVSYTRERIVAIEVKSRDSNPDDLKRGVFQCVKYHAVLVAQSLVEQSKPKVECWLVTEAELPSDLKKIVKLLKVNTKVLSS